MIGILIHNRLSNFQPLADLVGGRIYPLTAPENVDLPFVVYDVRYFEPDYVKSIVFDGNGVVDNVFVTINVASLTYKGLQDIVGAVRSGLEGETLTYLNITTKQIKVYSIAEGFNQRARTYVCKMEFQFLTNRILP